MKLLQRLRFNKAFDRARAVGVDEEPSGTLSSITYSFPNPGNLSLTQEQVAAVGNYVRGFDGIPMVRIVISGSSGVGKKWVHLKESA